MTEQPKITIHPPHVPHPPRLPIDALYMACRRCAAVMERGSQCPRCGAWCR